MLHDEWIVEKVVVNDEIEFYYSAVENKPVDIPCDWYLTLGPNHELGENVIFIWFESCCKMHKSSVLFIYTYIAEANVKNTGFFFNYMKNVIHEYLSIYTVYWPNQFNVPTIHKQS